MLAHLRSPQPPIAVLADEVPEEFVRRAAALEHTFLQLARPSPAGARIALTLFDAGPSQLGRPRLVHIAALIVLARRAEAAGARFAWGVVQAPGEPLFPDVTAAGVLHLLDARTPCEADPTHLDAWQTRIGGWKELDDLWIVGASRLQASARARAASLLEVCDVLEPGSRTVAVTLRRGAAAPAEITLELPPEGACARLLRDPFRVTVAPPRVVSPSSSPASNLVFSPNGAKLFARSRGGGVVVYPISNSPRAGAGKPKRRGLPGEIVAAVGWAGRSLVLATVRDGAVILTSVSRRGRFAPGGRYISGESGPLPSEPFRPPDEATALYPCLLGCGGGLPHDVGVVLDADGKLFFMTDSNGMRLHAWRVSAIANTFSGVAFVGQMEPGQAWRLVAVGESGASTELEGDAAQAFFGFGGHLAHPQFGLVAIEHGAREWTIRDARGTRLLIAPRGTRVVGVARSAREREEAGLVILEEDAHSLSFIGRDWNRRLPPAPARIEQVTVSPAAAHVAYSTAAGDLFVYSLDHDAFLYRLLREGE